MPIDYQLVSEHCREGMRRYIEQGILPGDFLRAILCNDFVEAVSRADIVNAYRLHNYARFLYQAPRGCWGSRDAMMEWHQRGGLQGIQNGGSQSSQAEGSARR